MKKSSLLRRYVDGEEILVLPGAFNCVSSKIAEQVGFKGIYVGGNALIASSLGLPDAGLATETEMVTRIREIVKSVSTPVVADADTGYGNAVNVTRTVRDYIDAGVAGIQIEDQVTPKKCGHEQGKRLVPIEEAVGKIKAAHDTRRELDKDALIIARTDARTAENGSIKEVIKRAKAYVKAGADVIFPESPLSVNELQIYPKNIEAPLLANMVEGGKTPLLAAQELAQIGYKIVIWPISAMLASCNAITQVMQELLKAGTTSSFQSRMWQLEKYHSLTGFPEIRKLEKIYLTT